MNNGFKHIDYLIESNPLLEELYYMLSDIADFGVENAETAAHSKVYGVTMKALEATMSKQQRALFDKLTDELGDHLAIHTKQAFIYGYKVALRLAQSE